MTDNTITDKETLLSAGEVRLFGRVMLDLKLDQGAYTAADAGMADANHMIEAQLRSKDTRLARIYGFTYEGAYYSLPKPAVFLVHGAGVASAHTGQATAADLALPQDLAQWSYDRWDHTIRLDVSSGPLHEILLNRNIDDQGLQSHYSGKLVAGRRGQLVD